jgi:hypothetical protein
MSGRQKRAEKSLRRGIVRVLKVKGLPNRVKRAMKRLADAEKAKQ